METVYIQASFQQGGSWEIILPPLFVTELFPAGSLAGHQRAIAPLPGEPGAETGHRSIRAFARHSDPLCTHGYIAGRGH